MLRETENYLTPYEWPEYNILMLPDTMPDNIAGMENPQLTIAAPEAVTGSSSTVALHEMAHSWFGNLLKCNTWGDFWLNEAFATFVERKMTRKVLGRN
jgi:leukotriene-A4 hydrolase